MQIIDDSDAVRVWAAELIRGRISFGVNDGPSCHALKLYIRPSTDCEVAEVDLQTGGRLVAGRLHRIVGLSQNATKDPHRSRE
ncbi:hypothetical protein NPIL_504071 [Nephila pilipes]|uniref:Uncharacterized protein n=1 Tax=Nephila pilipes TaxID=299642 RepID=A0A8X6TRS1_NEPPI|nr:hypothetical protein NPIL_504071 [Nephila pilipes]